MNYTEAKQVLSEVFVKPFKFTIFDSNFESGVSIITTERQEESVEGTEFILKMFTSCNIGGIIIPTEWRTEQVSVSDYYLEGIFADREVLRRYFVGFREKVEQKFLADALDTFGFELVRKENK